MIPITTATSNRLSTEKSPYLLQHSHNPVDWYPWGEEALRRAKEEDKPILLSVGYSACHWCHVMERECFEDREIAGLMNGGFVSIKVDREERPEIDSLFQPVAQAATGGGGWPLTVFLTPDLKPFYGGTYFPPKPMYGRISFPQLLTRLSHLYKEEPDKVKELTEQIGDHSEREDKGHVAPEALEISSLDPGGTGETLASHYDQEWGGFGCSPKFPNASGLNLMLRLGRSTRERYSDMVVKSLNHMMDGGIYDHLGGGFHRYSTDRQWLVPHFEKMLYDNALLPATLLDAYRHTGDGRLADGARGTLDYLIRRMRHPEGGFYSTEDADSEGAEGLFYVWTPSEIKRLLPEEEARLYIRYYGITEEGNFEGGKSIPHLGQHSAKALYESGMSGEDAMKSLNRSRSILFREREKRTHPFRDEKIIAAWNGLAMSAMCLGGRILGDTRYTDAAKDIWDFIERNLITDDRLLRSYLDGPGITKGFLEDYAFVSRGLMDLYQATQEITYLQKAVDLLGKGHTLFWDPGTSTLYDVGSDAMEGLPARAWGYEDEAIPSGASVFIDCILRLGALLEAKDKRIMEIPERVLERWGPLAIDNPWGFSSMIGNLDHLINGTTEIVLVPGTQGISGEDFMSLFKAAWSVYVPDMIIYALADARSREYLPEDLVKDRTAMGGQATAYVCKGYACHAPVMHAEALKEQLTAGT